MVAVDFLRCVLALPEFLFFFGLAWQASNDFFGAGAAAQPRNGSIHRSTDDGKTWSFSSWAVEQYWSTLFVRGSEVYTLGVSGDNSGGVPAVVVIQQSLDDGLSWTKRTTILQGAHGYSTGPTPVLFFQVGHWSRGKAGWVALVVVTPWCWTGHQGRIWRAIEYNAGAWGSGYDAVLVSAAQDCDLMDPSSTCLGRCVVQLASTLGPTG